ncbi:MAG TPA: NAD(P)-dependent oxidoreductase [Acidimicrobiales bacterium]|nr:NAD(P)-dependent oxidoreductase [Acidimicrobiales bacterium]
MQGQKVLFVGGQGPVSAPALRLLTSDNDVSAMARFSKPGSKERLESSGVACIRHDLFEPFDDLPDDFDYVFHSALPLTKNATGRSDVPSRDRWPSSFDAYADATGRLMAHCRSAKGFLFASTISVYDPPGGKMPVTESHSFGIHTTSAYSFTKVANEAVVSYLSRSLDIQATIIRVGSASGVDGGPVRDRLDRIVQGRPIRLHPDAPTYTRPIFEPDCARLGVAALEAGRVPPLAVNWCGDDVVTVEEYCMYMGELIGKEPTFEYTNAAWCSLVADTTFMHEVLGHCEVTWREGCRMLVAQCYPELVA